MKLIKRYFPFIFIFFLWLAFSAPFFAGKVPYPSNYLVNHNAPWSAYERFWGPVKNASMPDILGQIYPWKHLTIEALKEGVIPLWNPYSFGGTVHLANYQSAALSPFNLIFLIFDFVNAWSILVLLQPLLAGFFTYLFLRSIKRSEFASLIGAVSFMFCGFITTWMEYATLGYAILFLPLALFAIEKFKQEGRSIYLFLLSASIPLSFLSGHFQISLYFILFVISYLLFASFQTRSKMQFALLFLSIFFGLMLSAPQILPSIEAYSYSLRSEIFQKIEVIPFNYVPTFFAPDFFGNPVTRNAWLGHYAEWNAYAGIIPIFLAIFALIKRKKETLFFVGSALISLLLAFDTPLLSLLVALKIPVLSTAAASRIIVIFSFSVAILAAFGFDYLTQEIRNKKISKKLLTWFVISLAIMVGLWILVFLGVGLNAERKLIARNNLILPTVLFGAAVLGIGISYLNKRLFAFLGLGLFILVSFDMLRFANKWIPFDPKSLVHPSIAITEFYPKISSSDRVHGNFGAENTVYYRLPGIEGYDAVYNRRYGEFIKAIETGKVTPSPRSEVIFSKNGKYAALGLDFLGIKYIVHKVSDDGKPWSYPFNLFPPDKFDKIFDDGVYRIFEAKDYVPRAFLTSDFVVEADEQKIIDILFSMSFDRSRQIILEENPGIKRETNFLGSAKITNYTNNKVEVQTESSTPSLLFLSDVWYPGWIARIDGQSSKIYRADYTFRAVTVPEGKHKVEFIYNPQSFRYGVSLAGLGALGLFSMLYFVRIKDNGRK